MSVVAQFVGNGATTVTDINSQKVRLDKGMFVTFSDQQWAALTAAQKNYFVATISNNPTATELGYAERVTPDNTTNTAALSDASLVANKIAGLAVTAVGEGKPVDIEYYNPGQSHSVDQKNTYAMLLINGAWENGAFGCAGSSGANKTQTVYFKRRLVLTAGVSYTFEIGKWIDAAGSGAYGADPNYPMFLAVTRR